MAFSLLNIHFHPCTLYIGITSCHIQNTKTYYLQIVRLNIYTEKNGYSDMTAISYIQLWYLDIHLQFLNIQLQREIYEKIVAYLNIHYSPWITKTFITNSHYLLNLSQFIPMRPLQSERIRNQSGTTFN